MNCGFRCNIREDCNIFRMVGGSCIFGKTFWSVEGSDSGLEAYVEQNNRKIQQQFEIEYIGAWANSNLYMYYVACYFGWSFYRKERKCYKFYSGPATSDVAVELCKEAAPNDSGDLASVTSQEIVNFISNLG